MLRRVVMTSMTVWGSVWAMTKPPKIAALAPF
jgi:hypothetical protein